MKLNWKGGIITKKEIEENEKTVNVEERSNHREEKLRKDKKER